MGSNAIRANDFEASVGVGADLKGAAEPANLISEEMGYLRLSNMRVDAPFNNLPTYQALAGAGMTFDVITSSTDIPAQIAYFDSIASSIASIEGPDEPNSYYFAYNGLSGPAATDAFQADLFNAIKADPALSTVAVLPFSLSVGDDQSGYGDVSAYADAGNIHAYTSGGGGPNQSIAYEQNLVSTTPGKPDYLTETGYYTLDDGSSGVTDYVQAIWLVDSLLDGAADGVTTTFLYELNDGSGNSSDPQTNYGLFTASGQAKPSADAVSNLMRILADNGASASTFTPGAPNVAVSGLDPINGFDQVFAKSSGQTDIALWAEPQFYNPATGVTTIFSSPVNVTFDGGEYDVAVYDPLAGSTPIQYFAGVSSIQINLGNEPVIVELTPLAAAPVAAAAAEVWSTAAAITSSAITPGGMTFIGGQTELNATTSGLASPSGTDGEGLAALNAAASGAVEQPNVTDQAFSGLASQSAMDDINGYAHQLYLTGSSQGATGFGNAPDHHRMFDQP